MVASVNIYMPLRELRGWSGGHFCWISQFLGALKAKLNFVWVMFGLLSAKAKKSEGIRPVVTGIGGLGSLGHGPGAGELIPRLMAGESGVGELDGAVQFDGRSKLFGAQIRDRKWKQWLSREGKDHQQGIYSQGALAAYRMAVEDSGAQHFDPFRTKVFAAHGHVDANTPERTYQRHPEMLDGQLSVIHPLSLTRSAITAPAAAVARAAQVFRFRTITQACPSGLVAMADAASEIRERKIDSAIVVVGDFPLYYPDSVRILLGPRIFR